MKRLTLFLSFVMILPLISVAQGNGQSKNKNKSTNTQATGNDKVKEDKDKSKEKSKTDKQKHELAVWDGTGAGGPKPSKNQPSKVKAAFYRDYPGATLVSWSKYRGDWTATFRNGFYWSTAVYHANGARRDTRTLIPPTQLPPIIIDIFKKKPEEKVEDVVEIVLPGINKKVFRIKKTADGTTQYQYYNSDGKLVEYNY